MNVDWLIRFFFLHLFHNRTFVDMWYKFFVRARCCSCYSSNGVKALKETQIANSNKENSPTGLIVSSSTWGKGYWSVTRHQWQWEGELTQSTAWWRRSSVTGSLSQGHCSRRLSTAFSPSPVQSLTIQPQSRVLNGNPPYSNDHSILQALLVHMPAITTC